MFWAASNSATSRLHGPLAGHWQGRKPHGLQHGPPVVHEPAYCLHLALVILGLCHHNMQQQQDLAPVGCRDMWQHLVCWLCSMRLAAHPSPFCLNSCVCGHACSIAAMAVCKTIMSAYASNDVLLRLAIAFARGVSSTDGWLAAAEAARPQRMARRSQRNRAPSYVR